MGEVRHKALLFIHKYYMNNSHTTNTAVVLAFYHFLLKFSSISRVDGYIIP